MKLQKKIFNKCMVIPVGTIIHITKYKGKYKFCGIRDKRVGNECLLYSIPNNNNNECPYVKGFQRDELDNLWKILQTNNFITLIDFESHFPNLTQEGNCCFSAFYGLIDILYPNVFQKSGRKIFVAENFIQKTKHVCIGEDL